MTVTLFKGPGLAPGKSSRLVAIATTPDGKQLVSEGAGHGKVLWDSFDLEATVAQITRKGVVTLPADPRLSEGRLPRLRIAVKGQPQIAATIDIPVRYDVAFTANFSGAAGANGANGSDGTAGSDGAAGSMDPKNPQAGGNGSDGGPGANGENGQPGQPGQNVRVWVTLKNAAHPLLQIKVAGANDERLYLVDTMGGSLLVRADGGAGGSGGAGGHGGRGGAGGTGSPNGTDGANGNDGNGGWAGAGGAAGTIAVTVDPAAKPFLAALRFSNRNAYGVPGPAPEIREDPVPPLW